MGELFERCFSCYKKEVRSYIFNISSCATLKETFMAKYNGVLPRKT